MNIREQIVAIAAAENGVKENPPGSNMQKYGLWMGFNGVAWCDIFVSWVYWLVGKPLQTGEFGKGSASVPAFFNKFKTKATQDPKPGDIVIYDWNGDKLGDHIGIFDCWIEPGRSFKAWEGNTSTQNDSNGGEVMQRQRYKQSVLAFINLLD